MKPRTEEIEVEVEIPIKVKFSVIPPEKGSRDSMGVPEEPDYPAQLEDIELIYPEYDDLDESTKKNNTC